ncbi:MAG: sialidase family protein [Planctomycetota bacterium]|jgi:hypothetical protein
MNVRKHLLLAAVFFICFSLGHIRQAPAGAAAAEESVKLSALDSPIIIRGDSKNAYRDPAVLYHDGVFHLFFTLVQTDAAGKIYSYTAQSTSSNLRNWSKPKIITPKDQQLNYSSPGNIIRFRAEWVLCLQTYPRPGYKRADEVTWANQTARLFIMRSKDLKTWTKPEILKVKGPDVPEARMGRMIDPYLLEDKDEPGKWWCFFKQNGVSYSWSRDLENWTYTGHTASGENVCVLVDNNEYVLFHSPDNGIGVKRSKDLKKWSSDEGLITLGQKDWPWAECRITAATVVDLHNEPGIMKYVMFFHGGGPGKKKTQDNVDANCSIGVAWSSDLVSWDWPGKNTVQQGKPSVRDKPRR